MNKQELINKIKQIEGLSNDERAELVKLINTNKKYGLVWEDKPEDVEEQLRTQLPVLTEVVEKRILSPKTEKEEAELKTEAPSLFSDTDEIESEEKAKPETIAPNHIIIEGDNLHALTALTFTHEGEVDVIYIDPPYNTGSKDDFIYNDRYVDREDSFRHSKWLSFMYRRLKLAKVLLKEDGVFFCSIGDDEISQLTLLFDEIFGETNRLGIIARVAKTAGDKGNFFAPSKDYVVAYAKNKSTLPNFKDSVDDSLFKKIEKDGERKGEKYRDDVAFYQSSLDTRPNQRYFIQCPDGSFVIPPGVSMPEHKVDGAKANPIPGDGVWRWANETYFDYEKKILLVFKRSKRSPLLDENGNQAKWNIYTKSYLSDRSEKGASPRDYLDQFINRKGADLIKQYDIDFNYSKPYELIEHLIKITDKDKNITVLDFFAGSGSMLHATLNLNEADSGNRICIMSNSNENNICENVTYRRSKRIISLYKNSKGKEMKYYPSNNLRYYRSEFVNRNPSIKNKKELVLAATDLLCIKEDIYTEVYELGGEALNKDIVRCFADNDKYMMVIYDEESIEDMLPLINKIESKHKIKTYIFAPGQYPFTEEFEDVLDKVELCALPDAIYKAYAQVLPKKEAPTVNNEEAGLATETN